MDIAELNVPNDILEEIKGIDSHKIIAPTIPLEIYLQEADALLLWSADDLEELSKLGITQEFLNNVKIRIDICREVQTQWIHEKNTPSETEIQYKTALTEARKLRAEILRAFRFAYRNDSNLLKTIRTIANSIRISQHIVDLVSFHKFGTKHKEQLEKISFDFHLLDRANHLSPQLRKLHSYCVAASIQQKENKCFRDKCYTYLKHAVDELRNAGKFAFAKQPKRFSGYTISYFARKKQLHR